MLTARRRARLLRAWTRRNVINTQVFVSYVEAMIDLPQVEARINEQVTTTVMANPQVQQSVDEAVTVLPPRLQTFRPIVEEGIRSLVSAGVGRMLTSDPFRPLADAALTSAQTQLVSGDPVEFTSARRRISCPRGPATASPARSSNCCRTTSV